MALSVIPVSLFDSIRQADATVLIDVYADWCQPCHRMAPFFERVAAEFEPEARFLKLNTETEPEIAARYSIRSIPTLIVFKGGKPVDRILGLQPQDRIAQLLDKHVG